MIEVDIFPESDRDWGEGDWENFLKYLVELEIVTYKEIASSLLSAINPPQVGTGVASKKSFQSQHPPRKVMQAVMQWFYSQQGICEDCGTRLELQADHVKPRESFNNPDDADTLDNLELRCRRCNVIKRPSHTKGGLTHLTAAAGLMWILFIKRPKTFSEFNKLCRAYGMTMASVRFQEAWAMAVWLNKIGKYEIEEAPIAEPLPENVQEALEGTTHLDPDDIPRSV